MQITTWGTRGSIPTTSARCVRYGGSTTCIEVVLTDSSPLTPQRIIIDCGSGLAELGRRKFASIEGALMLQTHHHWDHIQGFPFFGPLFKPNAVFEFLSVDREQRSLEQSLRQQMTAPTFPVTFAMLPAQLCFQSVPTSGMREFGELTLRWAEVTHPSGSTAWRLDYRGASFVFSGDCEIRDEHHPCEDVLVELAAGADVLLMDAQYFEEEYTTRKGWGHSTPTDAVSVAQRAQVRRLLLTHHDPSHDDERLDLKAEFAQRLAPRLTIGNAHDGLVIELPTEQLALAS